MSLSVIVADDQALLRAGLAGIIDLAPDLQVVGQAENGQQAVELARLRQPDVVLMDIRMPVLDGLEATRLITENSAIRVLMLTTFDLDEYVYAALRNGASGFLLKDTPPTELLAGIRIVARGDALLAPGITRRLITEFAARPVEITARPQAARLLAAITEREREVWLLVAQGQSNVEIATALHIGPGTAKTHVSSLLTKLAARDRIQLVILAHQIGLIC